MVRLTLTEPALDLDFHGPGLDGQITFTRATAANVINASGLLQNVTSGLPRFDYDPVTLKPLGMLLEQGTTNLCLQSANWSSATWTKTSMTANNATESDPTGGTLYGGLIATAANAQVTQVVGNLANGTVYTFSVDIAHVGGNSQVYLTMDGANFTAVAPTASLTRVSMNQNCTTGSFTVGIRVGNSGDILYSGGAQLEANTFVTTRLTTSTANVTRNLDVMTMCAPLPWLQGGDMTFFYQFAPQGLPAGSSARFMTLSDSSNNNRIIVQCGSSYNLQVITVVNGSNYSAGTLVTTMAVGTEYRVGISYGDGQLSVAVNGTIAQAGIAVPPQVAAWNSVALGPLSATGGSTWARRLKVYRRAMSLAQLAALTQ